MIEYQITIERREPNPLFREHNNNFSPMTADYRSESERQPYQQVETARLTLTETEYQAVKEALFEHWATKMPLVTRHD